MGCGLDVYYVLDPPNQEGIPSNEDSTQRFFSFNTSNSVNQATSSSIFLGYDIYYKIYNDYSQMTSQMNSISSSNTKYSESGISLLKNYGYQTVKNASFSEPLIPAAGQEQKIRVRLYREGANISSFDSGIFVDGVRVSDVLRCNGKSFAFFDENMLPVESEADVKFSQGTSSDVLYVNAYAVTVGRDTNFKNLYSSLLSLGYIINKK